MDKLFKQVVVFIFLFCECTTPDNMQRPVNRPVAFSQKNYGSFKQNQKIKQQKPEAKKCMNGRVTNVLLCMLLKRHSSTALHLQSDFVF